MSLCYLNKDWIVGKQTSNRFCSISVYLFYFSSCSFSFSLEHRSSLHKLQKPTDEKPKVNSFYLSSISGKKLKSLTCVSFVLADNVCAVSFQYWFAEIHLSSLWYLQAHMQTICLLLLWWGRSLPQSLWCNGESGGLWNCNKWVWTPVTLLTFGQIPLRKDMKSHCSKQVRLSVVILCSLSN